MPKMTSLQQCFLFVVLLLVMAATRSYHLATLLHLPDASPALFFVGGLLSMAGWWFGGLLLAAALIDYFAITYGGVGSFCISPAYVFLVPAYLVMWLAGIRVARGPLLGASRLISGVILLSVASLASFFLSTASFHFLSGRIAAPGLDSLMAVTASHLPAWMGSSFAYVGVVLLVGAILYPRGTAGKSAARA